MPFPLPDAGLENIEVFSEQLGYQLKDANEWWDVVWNSGFRGPVSQLSPEQLEQFKQEHLAEVDKLAYTQRHLARHCRDLCHRAQTVERRKIYAK
jgi:hypothetical protein